MLCPKCQNVMHTYEHNGVVVDQCTECRGLFLDRGELERLIAAENSWRGGEPMPATRRLGDHEGHRSGHRDDDDRYEHRRLGDHEGYRSGHRDDDDDDRYEHRPPRKKRSRSFLENLFDD